jgi:hypothetical protein
MFIRVNFGKKISDGACLPTVALSLSNGAKEGEFAVTLGMLFTFPADGADKRG